MPANGILIREGDSPKLDAIERRPSLSGRVGGRAGLRFLGVNSHNGMLIPNPSASRDGARYAEAPRRY